MKVSIIVIVLVRLCFTLPSLRHASKVLEEPLTGCDGAETRCGLWDASSRQGEEYARLSTGLNSQRLPNLNPLAHNGLAIEDAGGWIYTTTIQLGNPPQSFRAAIDIGWSDLFVPSTNCTESTCSEHNLYDSAQSSSYHKNGTEVFVHYGGYYSSGYASRDTLWLGNIVVERQAFEEATLLKPVPLWDDQQYESVLGLSRLEMNLPQESSLRVSGPFHNIINQGLLQRNLFSLKLSDSDAHVQGELRFGHVNHQLYSGRLHTFPVTSMSSNDYVANAYLSPGWQIAAHSLALRDEDGKYILNHSTAGYAATFSSSLPIMYLPRALGRGIIDYLGADKDSHTIDCEKREGAPDLVISLGDDAVQFVMKPEDYIRKSPNFEQSQSCQVEIGFHDEPEDGAKYMILGSVFLARWYSVFDADNAQISFAALRS